MDLSLNQRLAEALLGLVETCSAKEQPSEALLAALRTAIGETTKAGNFEQLEAKVESLTNEVRGLKTENALRFPRVR